jgi:phospholipid/cholesterol/gamma-HCH transport system substrate-binding protein
MERRVNYILVGAFALILVAGFVLFLLWAHEHGNGRPMRPYLIYFDQAVNGLNLGSSVRYLGVEAGQVQAIDLDTSQTLPRVRVTVGIDASIPIVQGTIASLKPSGITGVSFIDLSTDASNTKPLAAAAGDAFPVIRSQSSGFDRLFDSASDSLQRLDLLLSEENLKHIGNTINNLDRVSSRIDALLAAHDASLNRLLGPDLDDLGATIRATRKTMEAVSALAKSLNDNPSQLLFPKQTKGVRIEP